jgi:phosphohistidine phosphatase
MLTAMRLILLRHAKAEKAKPGMSDRDRALNARGRSDAARMGAYLSQHGLAPDRSIVSPARRTRETWEAAAAAFSPSPPVTYDERLYNAYADAILGAIKDAGRSGRTLLLIGHNPGVHESACRLIGAGDIDARERLNEGLPTAALVVVDFAGENWQSLHVHSGRLERFVTPRLLRVATD